MIIVKNTCRTNIVKIEFNRHKGREIFLSITPRMIKCVASINHYGDRIENADKSSTPVVVNMCRTDEDWEHAILCEKNKKKENIC